MQKALSSIPSAAKGKKAEKMEKIHTEFTEKEIYIALERVKRCHTPNKKMWDNCTEMLCFTCHGGKAQHRLTVLRNRPCSAVLGHSNAVQPCIRRNPVPWLGPSLRCAQGPEHGAKSCYFLCDFEKNSHVFACDCIKCLCCILYKRKLCP